MARLPDRIWILGSSCAGKTTLAARIAEADGRALLDLDQIAWQPGWRMAPDAEIQSDLEASMAHAPGGRWVVSGSYSHIRDQFLPRCELIVWLDLPLLVLLSRMLRRTALRIWRRESVCNGNRETLLNFLHPRTSLLVYLLRNHRRQRKRFARELEGRRHVRLRTAKELRAWIAEHPVPAAASAT